MVMTQRSNGLMQMFTLEFPHELALTAKLAAQRHGMPRAEYIRRATAAALANEPDADRLAAMASYIADGS
jgi:hypothetical protein